MKSFFRFFLTILFILGPGPYLYAQFTMSPDDVCRDKGLSPERCMALKAEISKYGGSMPEIMKGLQEKPDLKDMKPVRPEDKPKTLEGIDKRGRGIRKKTGEPPARKELEKRAGEEAKRESFFDRFRLVGKYQDISKDLKPFGRDFFTDADVRVTTDRTDIPVPMDYIVGPGDEVKILLWGRVSGDYVLEINRDGKITLPQIGAVSVGGMKFSDMSKKIISLIDQVVGANVDITMGSLKTIPVFILGDVQRPGAYNIGSSATITNALLLAGGPSDIGSMRKVQLKRNNQIIKVLDLYDLFLKGDKSNDAVLQGNDIIFVPTNGPLVGVAGNVKRPAIYELKDRFDLQHLFDLAGGILPTANTQQIQISRIQKNERQIIFDLDDKNLSQTAAVNLQDADLVHVFPIVDRDLNAVHLYGNVKRPGKYEYKSGMKIRDLIKAPTDLLDETYFEYALIKRIRPADRLTELVPFNLGRCLLEKDASSNLELKPEDIVFVFSSWLFKDKPSVTVQGEVRGPILLSKEEEGKKLLYFREEESRRMDIPITKEVRGIPDQRESKEYLEKEEEARRKDYGTSYSISRDEGRIPEYYKEFREKEGEDRRGDYLILRDEGRKGEQKTVEEEIRVPFDQTTKSNVITRVDQVDDEKRKIERFAQIEKVRDIEFELIKARKLALLEKIQDIITNLKTDKLDQVNDHIKTLEKELRKIERFDLAEKLLTIRTQIQKVYRLEISQDTRVKDVLLGAGGVTKDAFLDRGEIVRRIKGGQAHQTLYFNVAKALAGDIQENLLVHDQDKVIIHSIYEFFSVKNVYIEGDVSKPGTYQYTNEMRVSDLVFKAGHVLDSAYLEEAEISTQFEEKERYIRLDHKQINLKEALKGNPVHNVLLKPWDRIFVKRKTNWQAEKFVNISGEVLYPGRYVVKKGERISSLIQRAGGYTDRAFLKGTVFKRESTRELQQRGLDEIANRMEREMLVESGSISTAVSADAFAGKKAELEQKQKFIRSIRQLKAVGRMSISLATLKSMVNSPFDIELEDGDSLNIPPRPSVINVTGAVMSPGSFIFNGKLDYEDYIYHAGGYAGYANKKDTYILKVDGTAQRVSRSLFVWNKEMARWEFRSRNGLDPGDMIVVPEKIERIAWLREFKDITQVLMQMAVTAGVVIKLF
jgi:protein involved in polysaccharide export with SLBB domain